MAAPEDVSPDNLDKVREILFGEQVRSSDKRFERLEQRLGQDVADLRTELLRRIDAVEQYAMKELESAGQRLTEHDGKLSAQAEQHARDVSELRQRILEQSKQLRDELVTRTEELSRRLDRDVASLRDEKVDRHALASLLAEVAVQLRGADGTSAEADGAPHREASRGKAKVK